MTHARQRPGVLRAEAVGGGDGRAAHGARPPAGDCDFATVALSVNGQVVTAPANVVSAVAVGAYKKYVPVRLCCCLMLCSRCIE